MRTSVWVADDSIDKTQVVLVDANDGEGIEPWFTLPQDDKIAFEHDEELLAFASTEACHGYVLMFMQ